MAKACVYMPTGKVKDYLPYFKYEEDDELEGYAYLLKEVRIKPDSEAYKIAIESMENFYNLSNSEFREGLESFGLKFEYVLNPDQTNSYKLVLDDVAKEYISKVTLNIAVVEGSFEPLVVVLSSGYILGNADAVESLDSDSKKFIDELVEKKLLKKKTIKLHDMEIPEEFMD